MRRRATRKFHFLVAPSPCPFVVPSPHLPSPVSSSLFSANSDDLDIAFQVVTSATGLSVVAAEDLASVALFSHRGRRSSRALGLRGGVVLFDNGRRREFWL